MFNRFYTLFRLSRLLCSLCSLCLATEAAALPTPIAQALAYYGLPETAVAIWVQALDSETPELVHNGQTPFNPASVMKLITTAAALDQLGPVYTFQTRVWAGGSIQNGVLEGSLYIEGGGDPALTQARAWQLLHDLRQSGLSTIHGDLILDGHYYALPPLTPTPFDDAPLKPYNAQPSALLINHNTVALHLRPATWGLTATLDPPAIPVDTHVHLDPISACPHGTEGLELRRLGDQLSVSGHYPINCGERTLWVNLLPPETNTAVHLATLWKALGGTLTGQVRWGPIPANANLLLSHPSLPLASLVRDVNKFSNNVMARMLFLNLGARHSGQPATLDSSRIALHEWLANRNLASDGLIFDNGSGLSREERLTADTLTRLLRWTTRQPWFFDFAASLPILGVDGTLKNRLADTPLTGKAWLKTGSLNGSRTLAGFVRTQDGRLKTLVFLINHPRADESSRLQETLLRWVILGGDTGLLRTN